MKLETPKNQWALAVRLLIENYIDGVTMVTAMKDHFHKFQSRLGELERFRKERIKIKRVPTTTKNRFNHVCTYTTYKSEAPRAYLINLYNKINKIGVNATKLNHAV